MSDKPENEETAASTINIYDEFVRIKDIDKAFLYLKYERKRIKNDILKLKHNILSLEYEMKCREYEAPTLEEINNSELS